MRLRDMLYYRRCRSLACSLGSMHTHHLSFLGRLRWLHRVGNI